MTNEQLIEEAVERFAEQFIKIDSDGLSYIKIEKNVSMRIDDSVFPRIKQFLRDELSTIASKSAEEGRNQVHEEYLGIHKQELTPILKRKFEEWKQFVSKLALSNPTTLDTLKEGDV